MDLKQAMDRADAVVDAVADVWKIGEQLNDGVEMFAVLATCMIHLHIEMSKDPSKEALLAHLDDFWEKVNCGQRPPKERTHDA